MAKYIDLSKTVYELVNENPDIKDIMVEIGFKDITNNEALMLMGKVVTIPKGAKIKKISMDKIIETFKAHGYEVLTQDNKQNSQSEKVVSKDDLLRSYIQRLNMGEDLESVRKDFVKNFESVSVHEILKVEQDMIDSGTDVEEVQKLCDLHSALFHGKTEQEIYMEEEKEMMMNVEEGHPIDILRKENVGLESKLDELSSAVEELSIDKVKQLLQELKKVRILYGKKEELIMPMLYRYGVTGPSDVMWGVDDEIKAEFSALAKEVDEINFINTRHRVETVINRTKEMIYKEENILFPMALERFSEEEWIQIYDDIDEMGTCFVDEYPKWEKAEEELNKIESISSAKDNLINLSGGKLTVKELEAILKLLPIDITFIDTDENNQFFANEGKVFSRPKTALGRKVYECHPPRIVPVVENMIREFKAGIKDNMEIWTPNPENPIRVQYHAVRDENGNYLGTVELVQQFKNILENFKGRE